VDTGTARWRRMAWGDLPAVERVGEAVHPDFPEDAAIAAERLRLYPAGCLVLEGGRGVQGYAVAHPWLFGRPPPLNTALGRLPVRADTFYIHDLAIAPGARGGGLGTTAVDLLAQQARRDAFASLSLVAVGRSAPFWRRNGFAAADHEAARAALETYAGAIFMARTLP
jgi:GNAT superfamily N-acetyltransferase